VVQTVNLNTTTTLDSSTPNASLVGQDVKFTATVMGGSALAGSVAFYDGSTYLTTVPLDGSNTAAWTTSALAVGGHQITAVYSGDANDIGSSDSSVTQTVDPVLTTVSLTSDGAVILGQTATYHVTVTPSSTSAGVPTGSVELYDNGYAEESGSLDSTGSVTFYSGGSSVGSHTLTAVYISSSGNFLAPDSPASTDEEVNPIATILTLTSDTNPAVLGQNVNYVATVAPSSSGGGTPMGSVTFYDGVSPVGTVNLDNSGQATLTSSSTLGSHPLTAVYGTNSSIGGTTSNYFQGSSAASTLAEESLSILAQKAE
jgi:hypothetical protein